MSDDIVDTVREAVDYALTECLDFVMLDSDGHVEVVDDASVSTESIAEAIIEKLGLRREWGVDVRGRNVPNPDVLRGDDNRPAAERPTKLSPRWCLYQRISGKWTIA